MIDKKKIEALIKATDYKEFSALQESLRELLAENAALQARVQVLEENIVAIVTAAGRDVPDAIDNDGHPYQSQHLDSIIKQLIPETPPHD